MNNNIRQPVPPSSHFRNSGDELRYSKACADNRCGECEWDGNDCDCAASLGETMNYTMTTPCDQCPFLDTLQMRRGFPMRRLKEFASGEFPCHKSANGDSGEYVATKDSVHCAGALIFNEKRETPHQMMRICERLGFYDMTKLNMEADVR